MEAVGLSGTLSATGADLLVGFATQLVIAVAVSQTGDDLRLRQCGLTDRAIYMLGHAGADAGSRYARDSNGPMPRSVDGLDLLFATGLAGICTETGDSAGGFGSHGAFSVAVTCCGDHSLCKEYGPADTAVGTLGLALCGAGGSNGFICYNGMSLGRYGFGLGVLTNGTGVYHETLRGTGGILGENAGIPIVVLGGLVSAEGTDGGMGVGSVGACDIAVEAVRGILPGENGIALVDTLYIGLVCRT
jgi:hypothetical protein